jgi:hypothetical protein
VREQAGDHQALLIIEIRRWDRAGLSAIATLARPQSQGEMHVGVSLHQHRYAIRLPDHSPLQAFSDSLQQGDVRSQRFNSVIGVVSRLQQARISNG